MLLTILLSLLFTTPATRATFMAASNNATHQTHKNNNYRNGSFVADEFIDHWGHIKLASRLGYSDVSDVITYRVNDEKKDTCISITLCNVLYNSEEYIDKVDSIRFIFRSDTDYWTEVIDGTHTFEISDALERRISIKNITHIKVFLKDGRDLFYDVDNGHNVILRYVTHIDNYVNDEGEISTTEGIIGTILLSVLIIVLGVLLFMVAKIVYEDFNPFKR